MRSSKRLTSSDAPLSASIDGGDLLDTIKSVRPAPAELRMLSNRKKFDNLNFGFLLWLAQRERETERTDELFGNDD